MSEIFYRPKYVVWNPGAETENAVYDLPCSGKRWMVVAIRTRRLMPCRIVSTIYAVDESRLPDAKWKLLHGTRD
jgi:hypothetical protein